MRPMKYTPVQTYSSYPIINLNAVLGGVMIGCALLILLSIVLGNQ